MFIKKLTLKNFRNYNEETIEFSDGINILTGDNAQGKTNAVEAVFFLCTSYSPRAQKEKVVIKHGEEEAEIKGVAQSNYGDINVRIVFNANGKKSVFVNEVQVTKIGEFMGNIKSVFFNPSELKLVQESPEDRRRFLNVSLSQMSKSYFYSLQRYNKILLQRNNLLKNEQREVIEDTLPVWDAQLCKQAAVIISARNDFLAELSPLSEEKHAMLSCGNEKLKMKVDGGYSGDLDEIARAYYQDLKLSLEKDMRLGYTTLGPHRDDIKFILNDQDVRTFGSQGQQRTVALSVKLAEAELFKNKFGEYPILILDDVLSELDKKRQRRLIGAVEHLQTIFTATGFDRTVFKNKNVDRKIIQDGKVKEGR